MVIIISGETPHQEASSKSASSDAASTWSDGFTPFCIWHLNANWSKPCMRYWKLGNPVTCCWTSRHTNRGATCVRNIRKWKKSQTTEWRPKSPSTLTTPRPKRRNSLIHDKLTRRVVGPNRTLSCKGTDSLILYKKCVWWTEHGAQPQSHTHWSSLNVIKNVNVIVISALSTTIFVQDESPTKNIRTNKDK